MEWYGWLIVGYALGCATWWLAGFLWADHKLAGLGKLMLAAEEELRQARAEKRMQERGK